MPTIAYVVRPVGDGPFPLVVMNHGVSLNQQERSFFPIVEFRDAAMWFARRGYMVVAPSGSGYGAAALDDPERGLYSVFYSKIGGCDNPNFHDAGLPVALIDKWIIEYMADQKLIVPDNVIVVGQSAGGWAAMALSSRNVPGVRAIITFAAGRGGRVGGKPNNNCAPDKLVAATGDFGRTARVPMLWIYIENDTFFGPPLSKRMHQAYTEAGGNTDLGRLQNPSDGFLDNVPTLRNQYGAAVVSLLGNGYGCGRGYMMGTHMTEPVRQLRRASSLVALSIFLLLDLGIGAAYGQQTAKPEADRPTRKLRSGIHNARPARGKRDQVFRLAQVLFQDSWNEPGMPNDDQRYIRDGSVGRAHRPH
jgi:dienelactone hydrolase